MWQVGRYGRQYRALSLLQASCLESICPARILVGLSLRHAGLSLRWERRWKIAFHQARKHSLEEVLNLLGGD
jgi:hypothetical protein